MTDSDKQKKYEECVQLIEELMAIITITLSSNIDSNLSALELTQTCFESMLEYDALPESEKMKLEKEAEKYTNLNDIVNDFREPNEVVDEPRFKESSPVTTKSNQKKALLN
jgi:hypothetical protein